MYRVAVVKLIVMVESNIPDREIEEWVKDAMLDYCKYQDAVAHVEDSFVGVDRIDKERDN